MKPTKTRWLRLAIAPALCMLALIGAPSKALADYTGNCAGLPASVQGNININEAGNCTISQAVTATGNIKITSGGAINAKDLTSNLGNLNGNMLLTATGNIATGNLSTNGGTSYGAIEIKANTGGAGVPFIIGGVGNANGVNGSLNTSNTTGGGTDPNFLRGGIFITNGNSGSMAGITVTSMSNILVTSSGARSGIIILNAQNGNISLPTGSLSADGAAGQGAGYILLMAKNIVTVSGTIISASQDYTAGGTSHGVILAAQTVTVAGTGGLVVNANGNGISGNPATAFATLAPPGTFSVSSNGDYQNLLWTTNTTNYFAVDAPVTVSGAAPFTMTANGNYGRVSATAHPLTFTNKAVTLQSTAATSHDIIVGFNGTLNNTLGIGLNGTGTATIDVTGIKRTGDTVVTGGNIQLYGDNMTFNAPTVKITANGPTSGNGDGGTVYINSTSAKLKTTSKASISANAASAAAGTGNASQNAIIFYPGNATVEIGNDAGQIAFTATGGKKSGNGGNITVNPNPGDVNVHNTLTTTTPVTVSAIGTTGNGGKINLIGTNVSFAGTALALKADGGSSSGNGGEIHILGNGTANIGTATGAASLSAKAPGTANTTANFAGTIEVAYTSTLNVDGAGLLVTAGGNAAGGVINIHDIGTFTLAGTMRADGAGTGKAGSITVKQTSFNTMTLTNATISASGGCDTNANCGVVTINSPANIQADALTVQAQGTLGANGGNINVVGNVGTVVLDGADLIANASPSSTAGKGGTITVFNNALVTLEAAKVHADGVGTGQGGTVQITSGSTKPLSISDISTEISAVGGTNGDGGIINLPYVSRLGLSPTNLFYVNTFVKAAAGSGVTATSNNGGSVSINAVTCKKIFTGYAWPLAYWNCVNPASPSAADGLPALKAQTLIPSAAQALLSTNSAILYVFSDNAAVTKFFHSQYADPLSGVTFDEGTSFPRISVNVGVLENTVFPGTGNGPLNNDQLTEITSHEFGHAIDFVGGVSAYSTALVNDRAFLDSAGAPCQTGGLGPFNGLVDYQTNAQFCSGGGTGNVLNNPGSIYTGKTNSQIAAISQSGMLAQDKETYAQSFAYQDFVKTLPNKTGLFLTNVANGLFAKGYYDCMQVIGAQAAGVAYVRAHSYTCN